MITSGVDSSVLAAGVGVGPVVSALVDCVVIAACDMYTVPLVDSVISVVVDGTAVVVVFPCLVVGSSIRVGENTVVEDAVASEIVGSVVFLACVVNTVGAVNSVFCVVVNGTVAGVLDCPVGVDSSTVVNFSAVLTVVVVACGVDMEVMGNIVVGGVVDRTFVVVAVAFVVTLSLIIVVGDRVLTEAVVSVVVGAVVAVALVVYTVVVVKSVDIVVDDPIAVPVVASVADGSSSLGL